METPINNKKARMFVALGSVQLIIGILEVAFNIAAYVMQATLTAYIGPGYWCGLFAFLAGFFGISAGKSKRKSIIITFMVLSIISAVFTVGIIGIAAVGITKNAIFYYTFHESYDYYTPNAKSYLLRWADTSTALNSLLLIAGAIELIIAIISSVLCCDPLGENSPSDEMYPGVQCVNGAQQLNISGQVVTALNAFLAPTQAAAPVQPHLVQQHMMMVQHPVMAVQQPTMIPPPQASETVLNNL